MSKTPNLRNAAAFATNDLPALPKRRTNTASAPIADDKNLGDDLSNEGAPQASKGTSDSNETVGVSKNSIDKLEVPENVWLNVNQLTVWSGNPRHVIDENALDDLIDDIRVNGQQHAIDVIIDPEKEGHYFILGGQRRWKAISKGELHGGRILARVRNDLETIEQKFAAAFSTQMLTEPLKDIDYAISVARKSNEIGIRAMSRALEKNAGEISKLSQIGSLPDSIIEIFKSHPDKFTTTLAYDVATVHGKLGLTEATNFAREIQERDYTVKKSAARKEELLATKNDSNDGRKKRKSWNTQHFQPYGGILKTREDTGEISLQLKSLTVEQLEKIKARILEVLSNN